MEEDLDVKLDRILGEFEAEIRDIDPNSYGCRRQMAYDKAILEIIKACNEEKDD